MTSATAHRGVPHFTMGTYEEGLRMIGARSEVRFSECEINWPMIKYYCALVEDANPSYWDREWAQQQWGGLIAPAGMLQVWLSRIQWKPGGVRPSPSLADSIPLPGDTLINVSTEAEFLRPMRIGDVLNVVDEVVAITPEKTTRLGTGHFVTTVATYRNQRGETVARNTNQLFRFTKSGGGPAGSGGGTRPATPSGDGTPSSSPVEPGRASLTPYPGMLQRRWEDVTDGEPITRITTEVTLKRVVLDAAATWDYFPGHHNVDYAREQGQKTIYINTMFFQGFIDRVITDWAGPQTRILRRKMTMQRSIYAGDTMFGEGRVTARRVDDDGRHLLEVEIAVGNDDGVACPATATVALPAGG